MFNVMSMIVKVLVIANFSDMLKHCFVHVQADILLWDFARREKYAKFTLHKVKIERLVFSPTAKYLVSLGGGDDGR